MIEENLRTELGIFCDDHIDVCKIGNECFIEMENIEYLDDVDEQIQRILDEIRENFDVTIILVEYCEKIDGFDVNINLKISPWLEYQDEIIKKHENYIRRKRGLPIKERKTRNGKKNYHRIVKGGLCTRTHKQRYKLLGYDSKVITTSVSKEKLEEKLKTIRRNALKNTWPFSDEI